MALLAQLALGPLDGRARKGIEMPDIEIGMPQHRPVMVADDAKVGLGFDKIDAFVRRRAIADDIAQTPDRIVTAGGIGHDRFEGDKVGVNVRNNQYAHECILSQWRFHLKRYGHIFLKLLLWM